MSNPKLLLREQIQFVECIVCGEQADSCECTECYSCQELVCSGCKLVSGGECFCESCFDTLEENIICQQE